MKPFHINHWPAPAQKQIEQLLSSDKRKSTLRYAVFDADNTIWKHDLSESLLAFMEFRKYISKDFITKQMNASVFSNNESIFTCFRRLEEANHHIGNMWLSQVFAGFSLGKLKDYMQELIEFDQPIPVFQDIDQKIKAEYIYLPKVLDGQRELIRLLTENQIEVYIISAASEELVRIFATDRRHNLSIKAENIIGTNLLLQNPQTQTITTTRKELSETGTLDNWYGTPEYYNSILLPMCYGPTTWYEGKKSAFKTYVHPFEKPVLVAGDTFSDIPILFYCDARTDGIRILVTDQERRRKNVASMIQKRLEMYQAANQETDVDLGWIFVSPETLSG